MAQWRTVGGFRDYEVSDGGRVRSWRAVGCKAGKRRRRHPRLLRPAPWRNGYRAVTVGGKNRAVHRLVLEAFVGPCPAGMETRHLNGDRGDNRLENVCWGTSAENREDARRHGRLVQGEQVEGAKLTTERVQEARRRVSTGVSCMALAQEWGVGRTLVTAAVVGRTWRHVVDPGPIALRAGRPRKPVELTRHP